MIISYRRDSDEAAESEVAAVAAAAESSGAPGPGCRGPSGQPGLPRTRSSRLRPGPSDAVGPARCSDSARRGGWAGAHRRVALRLGSPQPPPPLRASESGGGCQGHSPVPLEATRGTATFWPGPAAGRDGWAGSFLF